ncbi:MAG: hypothetical protein Q9197_004583 [Variospora fuerteventurae]
MVSIPPSQYCTSSTWTELGIYPQQGSNLYPPDNATYGLDTVGLGNTEATGGPTLDSQVVAAIAGYQNVLGIFGLGQQPVNFTDFTNPRPSFLSTLHTRRLIPSLSWAYTAGARYRLKGVFGSLTLGGYDSSRFIPNDVSFNLAPDISRELVVGLQSITVTLSNGTTQLLLPSPHLTFIDSSVSDLFLPLEACTAFERVFGLQWNDTLEMYPVSDELHQDLVTRNPVFKLKIGNTKTDGPTVEINMPYSSFAINYLETFDSSPVRYFPIRRALKESHYTLGRVFLQETYLITNYEQGTFSVSQARFEEPMKQQIVPILPASGNLTDSTTSREKSSDLGLPKIAGIIVGAVSGFFLLLTSFCWPLIRRYFRRKRQLTATSTAISSAEDIQHVFVSNSHIPQVLGKRSHPSLQSLEGFYKPDQCHIPEIDRNSRNFVREVHNDYRVELPDNTRRVELVRAATPDPPMRQAEEAWRPKSPRKRHGLVFSTSSILSPGNIVRYWMRLNGLRDSQNESTTDQETTALSPSVPSYLQRSLPPTPIDESPQESAFPAWTRVGARQYEDEDLHPLPLRPADSFQHRTGFF